jgi:hypothetical protein
MVFQRLRTGYVALLTLAALLFALTFQLGVAPASVYFSTGGLARSLLLLAVAFPLACLAGVAIALVRRRIDRPTAVILRYLRFNRTWLLRGAMMAAMVFLLGRSFMSYKSGLAHYADYWADPLLADIDRAVLGRDAWQWTHRLIGPAGTQFLDRVYALWFFAMTCCMGWFCFTRDTKLQLRGLFCYLLCWGFLGSLLATSLASVGPCFFDQFFGGHRFQPMMERLAQIDSTHPLLALDAMHYLAISYGQDRPGAGISAMPSLHVAIAFLCFLATKDYSTFLPIKLAAAIFALLIFLGSVHLGWHYVSDGVVSMAATWLFWWLTGRYVDWLDARDRYREATRGRPEARLLRARA